MKTYIFSLAQQPRYFKVEAENGKQAKAILDNSDDITDYEFGKNDIWQPEFEPTDEKY